MIEKFFIDEITKSFLDFVENGKIQKANYVWKMLFYAKQQNWHNKDFFRYWLNKFVALEDNKGTFILGFSYITYNICEFNEKTLGEYVSSNISFFVKLNELEEAMSAMNYALQGAAFFDKSWIDTFLSELNIENKQDYLEINNKNEALYLNKVLKNK